MAVSDSFDRNSNRRGATREILRARAAEVTLSNVKLCLVRRHAETSEPIPCPSLRAKRSNRGAAVRPSGLLAPRMLWPRDCFVARAPRNDGWVAADPIDSVVIGRRLSAASEPPSDLSEFRRGRSGVPDHRVSKHLFIRLHGTRRAAGYLYTYLIFPAERGRARRG